MGILHFLGRSTPDRALFELGKFWYEPEVFFGDDVGGKPHYRLALAPHDLLDEATMCSNLLERLARDNQAPAGGRDVYARELARRITRFAGGHPVEFLNDSSSDMDDYRTPDDDLRVVDSAYTSDWKRIP